MPELQNHLKTRHAQTLEKIPNALSHRQNPSAALTISGMDGIPISDLQQFKARVRPIMQSIATTPTSTSLKQQVCPNKQEPIAKKAKIDTPLDPGTIQAQLAEFQKRKEQEEIQELLNSGIVLPPGLSPSQAMSKFIKAPPPGSGQFAAKPLATFPHPSNINIPSPATESVNDGKLGSSAAFKPQSQSQSTSCPASKSAFFLLRADFVDCLRLRLLRV
jgi:hypothetical protein